MLVALHGGFWREQYDRRGLRPLAVALRALGRVVVLPEYRRTGGRGGWPATFDDIRSLRTAPAGPAGRGGARARGGPAAHGGRPLRRWAPRDVVGARRTAGPAAGPGGRTGPGRRPGPCYADGSAAVPWRHCWAAVRAGAEAYAVADVAARLRAGDRPGCPLTVLQGTEDGEVPVAVRGRADRGRPAAASRGRALRAGRSPFGRVARGGRSRPLSRPYRRGSGRAVYSRAVSDWSAGAPARRDRQGWHRQDDRRCLPRARPRLGGKQVLLCEAEGRQGIARIFDVPPLPYEERSVALGTEGGEV